MEHLLLRVELLELKTANLQAQNDALVTQLTRLRALEENNSEFLHKINATVLDMLKNFTSWFTPRAS
jgi:hypothetical protein